MKKKIHERILEWREQKICKPAKPRNLNNLLLLLVAKVESGKVISEDYRVCLDVRPLNAKNWSKQFTLPKISDIIKKATKATMMADLDLKGAFHQVLLDEVSSELSAFMDPLTGERYQMTNMWFGESGSATQMQKVVHAVLGIGEPGTEDWRVYVDKRAVGLVEVGGGPQGALRSLEKVFGELVLGVKWVEEGALRKKLVRESHVETHEGEFHLFWRLLKRGFFWKDMRKDCRAEVRSCVDCLRFNVGARGFMLLRVRSVKLLMVEVYGDHVGPFPESGARGYKYILILVDTATRFVWLVLVVGVSGKETKEALEGVFRTVGWPGTLVMDGGLAFKNKEVSELLEGEEVEHQVCTPGAHEQNVPVERCVKEVQAILNKKCELRREGWSEVVLRVQEGLNMRLVKPLGSMPFDLFFARSPEMRREGRGEVEVSESELENVVRIGDRNEVMVKVVYPEVAEKVKKVREEVCKSKNRKRKKGKQFKEGEKVMVRVERQCKQDLFFKGPFVVRGFEEKKAEYQLARVGEEEVRVRTRHENLRGVGEVEEEGKDEVFKVTRVEGMRGEGEEKEFLVKWKGYRER